MFGIFNFWGSEEEEVQGGVPVPPVAEPAEMTEVAAAPHEENALLGTTAAEVDSLGPLPPAAADHVQGPPGADFLLTLLADLPRTPPGLSDMDEMNQFEALQVASPEPSPPFFDLGDKVDETEGSQVDIPEEAEPATSETLEVIRPGTYRVDTPRLTEEPAMDHTEVDEPETSESNESSAVPLKLDIVPPKVDIVPPKVDIVPPKVDIPLKVEIFLPKVDINPPKFEIIHPGPSKVDSGKRVAGSKTYTILTKTQLPAAEAGKPNSLVPVKKTVRKSPQPKSAQSASAVATSPRSPSGFKLYKHSLSVSNRNMILTAIERSVFAGPSPGPVSKRTLIATLHGTPTNLNHFLILFRNVERCPYRGLYAFISGRNQLEKVHGMGPPVINGDEKINKFLKYNSATKSFGVIETKHLSITIDGFTVADSYWTGNKELGKKQSKALWLNKPQQSKSNNGIKQ